jgi:hypothetical protein
VTAVGGVTDYVDSSMATFLPDDSTAAVAMLKSVAADQATFIEKAKRARQHVEEKVNWRHFAEELRRITDGRLE